MTLFAEWLKKRSVREDFGGDNNPISKFQYNTDDEDFADDYDKVLTELIKTVLRKYPEETIDFLNTIANRGDADVASLLKKISKGQGPRLSTEPRHPSDQDEVVPASADTGHNPEGGEE